MSHIKIITTATFRAKFEQGVEFTFTLEDLEWNTHEIEKNLGSGIDFLNDVKEGVPVFADDHEGPLWISPDLKLLSLNMVSTTLEDK